MRQGDRHYLVHWTSRSNRSVRPFKSLFDDVVQYKKPTLPRARVLISESWTGGYFQTRISGIAEGAAKDKALRWPAWPDAAGYDHSRRRCGHSSRRRRNHCLDHISKPSDQYITWFRSPRPNAPARSDRLSHPKSRFWP